MQTTLNVHATGLCVSFFLALSLSLSLSRSLSFSPPIPVSRVIRRVTVVVRLSDNAREKERRQGASVGSRVRGGSGYKAEHGDHIDTAVLSQGVGKICVLLGVQLQAMALYNVIV